MTRFLVAGVGIRRQAPSKRTRRRSVAHLKRRRILRLHLAAVVDAGSGNIRMPQPILDARDVGVVVEGVGGGRGAQRMGADLEAEGHGIATHELIDSVRGDGVVEFAGAVVADWSE